MPSRSSGNHSRYGDFDGLHGETSLTNRCSELLGDGKEAVPVGPDHSRAANGALGIHMLVAVKEKTWKGPVIYDGYC